MHWVFDEDVTVGELIEIQRRLARAESAFESVVGTLWAAGTLQKRLAGLTDRQIGQLLSDVVGEISSVFGPEMTICQHAALRLFRSAAERLTAQDIESAKAVDRVPKVRQ